MTTALFTSLTAGPVVLAAHLPAEVHAHGALAGQVLANQRTAGEGPTPGILGFIMTFVIALLVVGLVLAMTSSLRRVKHRAGQMGEAGRPADGAGPVEPHVPERHAVPRESDPADAAGDGPGRRDGKDVTDGPDGVESPARP